MAEKKTFIPGVDTAEDLMSALGKKKLEPEEPYEDYLARMAKEGEKAKSFLDFVRAKVRAKNEAEESEEKRLDETAIPEMGPEGVASFTDEAGEKAWAKLVNEAIDKIATHGIVEHLPDGTTALKTFSDPDGKACVALCRMAGIKAKLVYVQPGQGEPGAMTMDSGGKGVELVKDDDGTLIFYVDHHSEISPTGTSAAAEVYDILWRADLITPTVGLEGAIEFITAMDNGGYPGSHTRGNFMRSNRTLVGLSKYLKFQELVKFFEDFGDPLRPLTDSEISRWQRGKATPVSERVKVIGENIVKSMAEVELLESEGWGLDSERLGRILVVASGETPLIRDAALSMGFDTIVLWNEDGFLAQSEHKLGVTFPIGFGVREKMWLKPRDGKPMDISLKEVLDALTDGETKAKGALAAFLETEAERGEEGIAKDESNVEEDDGGQDGGFFDLFESMLNEGVPETGQVTDETVRVEPGEDIRARKESRKNDWERFQRITAAGESETSVAAESVTPTVISAEPSVEREVELEEQPPNMEALVEENKTDEEKAAAILAELYEKERRKDEQSVQSPNEWQNALEKAKVEGDFLPSQLLEGKFWRKEAAKVAAWLRNNIG